MGGTTALGLPQIARTRLALSRHWTRPLSVRAADARNQPEDACRETSAELGLVRRRNQPPRRPLLDRLADVIDRAEVPTVSGPPCESRVLHKAVKSAAPATYLGHWRAGTRNRSPASRRDRSRCWLTPLAAVRRRHRRMAGSAAVRPSPPTIRDVCVPSLLS